jgi:protein involved in polysaccharide export with SLBB domain
VTIDVPLVKGVAPPFRLEDGDEVQIDALSEASDQYTVAITGMVQQPGTYPWRPGMTLRQLVVLARGPKLGADLREAEVAKLPADRSRGQLATTVRVPLDSTYLFARDSTGRYVGPPGVAFPARGSAAEVPLEPFDNVLIFRQPDFELQRTVTITGEVMYPGTYALKAKDDRLADLVQRAGGLTPRAYAEGIRFVRQVDNRGRIDIDLPKALRDHRSRDNIILQPGDQVTIPEYQPSVRVTGAVNSPGSVLYQKGASLDYYLSAAGGFTQAAEKGQVSVHYANGEVRTRRHSLFFSSNPSPGPGSEVFVPAKDPNAPRTDKVALFGAIAQILASTVAIIVIAKK